MAMAAGRSLSFEIQAADPASAARAGVLHTPHGPAPTPTFMPVGTQGTVKALGPDDLKAAGASIILSNTYHLMLRPGHELIEKLGGLHRFMAWPGPILTDSGGYQVFSLARLRKLTEEGAHFQSHIDGAPVFLSPEKAVGIQEALGVDVMMCLDECTPYPADRQKAETSMDLTRRWAKRCLAARDESRASALFGIIQGATYPDLRRRAAEQIAGLGFDGLALGGLALGEPFEQRLEMIAAATEKVPRDKPLYLMGLGTPEDLVEGVKLGADLFDCVLPTRNARNGQFFTSFGRVVIKNAAYREDGRPVDEQCPCPACRNFSRAYLRHLYLAGELLFHRLAASHNLTYYLGLTAGLRAAIAQGEFDAFYKRFYKERDPGFKT